MSEGGLHPVILLEDADGLLRIPDKNDVERRATRMPSSPTRWRLCFAR